MTKAIEQIKMLIHFLKYDLWHVELNADSKLHNMAVEFMRVVHLVLKGLKEDNCKLHASALTYSLLMALVPFMVILFSISKAIGYMKAAQSLRESVAEMPDEIKTFVDQILAIVEGINPAAGVVY